MSKVRLSAVLFGAVLALSVMTSGSAATGPASVKNGGDQVAVGAVSDSRADLASWAMMIVGFGGAGAMIRSRRRLQAWAA